MKLNNPVLTSELKIKMRSFRTVLGITFYVGIMLFVAFLFYSITVDQSSRYGASINANQAIGMQLYSMLAVMQYFLILFITPAQTAGAISGEREKQTLDLLLCTRMSAVGIIVGKMLSSMAYVLLLIIASIPLFSLVFLFGGITPGDLVSLFTFYIVSALTVGTIGIFYSTVFKRTMTATVVSYVTIFAWVVLTFAIGGYQMSRYYISNPPSTLTPYVPLVFYLNPFVGLADLMAQQMGGGLRSVFGSIFGMVSNAPAGGSFFARVSPWIRNSFFMLLMSIGLIIASGNRIKPVRGVLYSFNFRRPKSE